MGIGKSAKKAQQAQIDLQRQAAKKAEADKANALSVREEAIRNIKFPTYLSTAEGQKYKQTLEERMAGQGLIDVNALTSPIAAQIRAGQKQTEAAIGSAASARGLGRSSVATSQIGAASQAAERDIAERMAQLELTRQQQIENAVSGFGDVSKTEAQSQQNKSQFDIGNQFGLADTIAGYAEQVKQDQFLISNSIAQKGVTSAANNLLQLQTWLSAAVGAAKTFSGDGGVSGAANGDSAGAEVIR